MAILAFVGGGLAVSWLSSAGLTPWSAAPPPAQPVLLPEPALSAPNPVAAAPVVPQIVQPIADSTRTEAMLVAMTARRAIESGAPLNEITPRLRAAFAQTQPEALARIVAADRERLTAEKLLAEFDAATPMLRRERSMTWQGLRNEASSLFVIRRSNSAPAPVDAQLQRARDYLAGGNVEGAMRFVAALPGADNAQGWMAKARRYAETQKALATLEQAALTMPAAKQALPEAAPAPPATQPGEPQNLVPL